VTTTLSPAFCNARANRSVLPGSTTVSFSATANHIGGSLPRTKRIGWLAARWSSGKIRSSVASRSGEIVWAGQPDHARDLAAAHLARGQIAAVGGEQRGDLCAGGMPHQEHAPRVAAERSRVPARPCDRTGRVVDEAGKGGGRIGAVVGHHGDKAARRQRLADEQIVVALARLPASP
jgi:hypothetical protein